MKEKDGAARVDPRTPYIINGRSLFDKAMHRVGRALQGRTDSVRKGQVQSNTKDGVALDLVEVAHGSPVAVVGLTRSCGQRRFERMDIGFQIIETASARLQVIQPGGKERRSSGQAGGYFFLIISDG